MANQYSFIFAIQHLLPNVDYYQYNLHCDAPLTEVLIAYLADAPFDTFEETPEGLAAYLPASNDATPVDDLLRELQESFSFTWTKTHLPAQNWNAVWESNFQPVVVNEFCAVRADFHEHIPGVRYELVINPKMAFGTGHHETTWMCLAALEHLPVEGGRFFDFGCGTGILAIMASKLGARELEAIDIEDESYRNTLENAELNNVHNLKAYCGVLKDAPEGPYDGILANINRNVILDSLPTLASWLKPGSWLLTSGYLQPDYDMVAAAAEAAGLSRGEVWHRGNWVCAVFNKVG